MMTIIWIFIKTYVELDSIIFLLLLLSSLRCFCEEESKCIKHYNWILICQNISFKTKEMTKKISSLLYAFKTKEWQWKSFSFLSSFAKKKYFFHVQIFNSFCEVNYKKKLLWFVINIGRMSWKITVIKIISSESYFVLLGHCFLLSCFNEYLLSLFF